MKILILGGTGEARKLAENLTSLGYHAITSLAGRTSAPAAHAGEIRTGGFGGAAGLADYLQSAKIERLVDATHPYAVTISGNAILAARQTGVPLVRLMRPGWQEPAGWNWRHTASIAQATWSLPAGAAALITTGHEGLETLLGRTDCRFIVRLIEPPNFALPAHASLVLDRPPYPLDAEKALLERAQINYLVTKNSGGDQTFAKLQAAHELGIATIMIDRPQYDAAPEAGTIEEALAALHLSAG